MVSCVVVGGGGFIGTNLCAHLAREGYRTTAFGHRFVTQQPGIRQIRGDSCDADAIAAVVAGADLVIDLAYPSVPALSEDNLPAALARVARCAEVVVAACLRGGVRRLVVASSGGTVYGPSTEPLLREDHPTDPGSAHGIVSLAMEKTVAMSARRSGLDYRILRIGNAYGPWQTAGRGQGFIAQAIADCIGGRPIVLYGDGSAVRDWIHVDDVCAALERLLAYRGRPPIFNIGSGRGASLMEVVRLVERHLDRAATLDHRSARPFDVARCVLSTELARTELAWAPTIPLSAGIERTLAWWRQEPVEREMLQA